jgi:integrase
MPYSGNHIGVTHSVNHENCPACLRAMRLLVEQGTLAQLEFRDAADAWLEVHKRYIAPRTLKDYRQYIRALEKFFGGMLLNQIHIGNLREYQAWRKTVPSLVNMELSCLQQILKEGKIWEPIAQFYKPLPVSSRGSGSALTPAEQKRLLAVAFSRVRWRLAAHCLQIMLMTGIGFGELRCVTRGDADLEHLTLSISEEGAKNEDRERTIPLNSKAAESMHWIIERWQSLGGKHPHDYLLPHYADKAHATTDFSRPIYGINRSWNAIRKEWSNGDPRLLKFRIYDCRVTAITNSLKSGKVSVHTAKRLYGHVSEAMQRRYYKPDMETLREAVALLDDAPIQRTRKMPPRSDHQQFDEHFLRQSPERDAG